MNDIFTSHIQVTRGQNRDAAAVELKRFLNQVLAETHPELGRFERVTIPLDMCQAVRESRRSFQE